MPLKTQGWPVPLGFLHLRVLKENLWDKWHKNLFYKPDALLVI